MRSIYERDGIGKDSKRILRTILPLSAMAILAGCATAEPTPSPIKPADVCKLVPHWVGKQSLEATVLDPDIKTGQTLKFIKIDWGDARSPEIVTSQIGDDSARYGLSTPEPHTYLGKGNYTVSADVGLTLANVLPNGQSELLLTSTFCMYEANVPHA